MSRIGLIVFSPGRSTFFWVFAQAESFLIVPILSGLSQSIWQAKVAQDVHGRVCSARRLIAWLANPLSPLIAGLLGDYIREPQMRNPGSPLVAAFGNLFGSEPGAGMALLIFLCGIGGIQVGLAGWLISSISHVESSLPDHDRRICTEASLQVQG